MQASADGHHVSRTTLAHSVLKHVTLTLAIAQYKWHSRGARACNVAGGGYVAREAGGSDTRCRARFQQVHEKFSCYGEVMQVKFIMKDERVQVRAEPGQVPQQVLTPTLTVEVIFKSVQSVVDLEAKVSKIKRRRKQQRHRAVQASGLVAPVNNHSRRTLLHAHARAQAQAQAKRLASSMALQHFGEPHTQGLLQGHAQTALVPQAMTVGIAAATAQVGVAAPGACGHTIG